MSETRTPDAERAALDDMLKSDGWTILRELVDKQFGAEANLQQIDEVMANLRPGDDERAVVTQIRAASKAAYTVLALATHRAAALTPKKGNAVATARDRLDAVLARARKEAATV